jgi:hypothetical protein
MKQVLWERGLLDPGRLSAYTAHGTKDKEMGTVDTSMSLKHILADCLAFLYEATALQAMGKTLGVIADGTPKFHAELAGEGIE